MPDLFAPLIQNLINFGVYNLFIWMLALAIMYAVLRKSKILGESPFVNGAVALVIAFFVFAFPILTGTSLTLPAVTFFTQATVFMLIFLIGFLLASFFYPDLPKLLITQFTRRTTLWALVALGIALFITSGLVGTFWSGLTTPSTGGQEGSGTTVPTDVIIIAAGVIIFIVVLMIAASVARST